MHPEVKAGRKTEDEVFMEYLETFENHHAMMAGQGADHEITLEEWIEYYQYWYQEFSLRLPYYERHCVESLTLVDDQ